MRIPHTIPRVVLQAYTRRLDEEALKKSYEGRLLRSEDPTWDEKVQPTLRSLCLENIVDEYVFYVKLVEELNKQKLQDHEKQHDQWSLDLVEYRKRKASYDRKMIEEEIAAQRREQYGDDPNAADDDYDDDDRPIKKIIREPAKVPDEFPEFEPWKGVLDQLSDEDRVQAVEDLDHEWVPFEMAVKTIPDDHFWERAAMERWPHGDKDNHGGKWRRLFLEKNLWEAIEEFHPVDGKLEDLLALVDLTAQEILEVKLKNLIPNCFGTPRKAIEEKIPDGDFHAVGVAEDAGFGDVDEPDEDDEMVEVNKNAFKPGKHHGRDDEPEDDEDDLDPNKVDIEEVEQDRTSSSHINFSLFLPKFVNLKVLSLVYEMAETGLDWEARFFKFTDEDCFVLAQALSLTPSIETFELHRSHVNDEQCKTLVREGLIKMPHLKNISFCYNRIGNGGARAIARLLCDESARAIHTIHTVRLARNKIYNAGGKALAFALTKNRHLTHLDLRLNRMGDPAGRDFAHALAKNSSLLFLSLGANRLTDNTAYIIGKMLLHNTTVKELDISSNDIGKKGGEHIALGIRGNKNILKADVRLANIGLDFEYDVGTHLRKNRNRILGQYSLVERDDHLPPSDIESGLIDPNLQQEQEDMLDWDDEEDEEEGEEEMIGDHDEEETLALKTVKPPTFLKRSVADMA